MSEFNVDDEVVITGNSNEHGFDLGERAVLDRFSGVADGGDLEWLTADGWYIFESDFELYEQGTQPETTTMSEPQCITAAGILGQAISEMEDRAKTYDRAEGERSMGRTVGAFNAITGGNMTEVQGWLFMAVLKSVRSQQGGYRADSFIDGAAYFALAGECASELQEKNQ